MQGINCMVSTAWGAQREWQAGRQVQAGRQQGGSSKHCVCKQPSMLPHVPHLKGRSLGASRRPRPITASNSLRAFSSCTQSTPQCKQGTVSSRIQPAPSSS